jgi:hypothetical protein
MIPIILPFKPVLEIGFAEKSLAGFQFEFYIIKFKIQKFLYSGIIK